MTERKEKVAHKDKGRIPEFKSREEEAEFWDTHDFTEYQAGFKLVQVRFAKRLSHALAIRFDSETLEKLRLRAQEKGIGPATLARMWILEHLQEEQLSTRPKAGHKK
jgi:predicted DNA binding CopG/RHH family protein